MSPILPMTIRHQSGSSAEPGHKYKGGVFSIRTMTGGWVQFGYGDPASNRPDTYEQAHAKAKAWLATNP